MLCYGTYGVPIKQTVKIPSVHPLILQSYKTIVMFALSWCVQLLGVPVSFTYWGIFSGLLWVLGGAGGIVAVRWAGMAAAVGTWASVMVLVNFVWGILIFQEPVANLPNTVAAFVLLGLGLIGMSRYSSPAMQDDDNLDEEDDDLSEQSSSLLSNSHSDISQRDTTIVLHRRTRSDDAAIEAAYLDIDAAEDEPPFDPETHFQIGGTVLRKRDAGIAGALFNGIMSGSALIPLHYSPLAGADYMISFASGGLIANLILWLIYYAVLVLRLHDLDVSFPSKLRQALTSMPEWHFRQLWIPGFFAGT